LALKDNPAHQLVCSQNWARHRYGDGSSWRAACPLKRPQSLKIGFSAYPSTMGGGLVDYLVADTNVGPVHQRQHYSEKLIVLPETYFPGDCASAITEPYSTRHE